MTLGQVGPGAGVRPEVAARDTAAGALVRTPAQARTAVRSGPLGRLGTALPITGEAIATPETKVAARTLLAALAHGRVASRDGQGRNPTTLEEVEGATRRPLAITGGPVVAHGQGATETVAPGTYGPMDIAMAKGVVVPFAGPVGPNPATAVAPSPTVRAGRP